MTDSSDFPSGPTGLDAGERVFRYRLPATPVAGAAVDIGQVCVRVELFLAGDLDVLATARRPGAEPGALRACTLKALRAMAKGLMVSGLGSYTPAITSGKGHRFSQTGHQFREPNTMAFAGACTIDFVQRCECGIMLVTGDVRYSLDVSAMPLSGRVAEMPATGNAWFVRHEQELASIGMVVLAGVPIAPGRLGCIS
jgi:hypothetical protein